MAASSCACVCVYLKNTLDGRFAGNFGCFSFIRVDQFARGIGTAQVAFVLSSQFNCFALLFVVVGKHSSAITATVLLLYYGIGGSQRCRWKILRRGKHLTNVVKFFKLFVLTCCVYRRH